MNASTAKDFPAGCLHAAVARAASVVLAGVLLSPAAAQAQLDAPPPIEVIDYYGLGGISELQRAAGLPDDGDPNSREATLAAAAKLMEGE